MCEQREEERTCTVKLADTCRMYSTYEAQPDTCSCLNNTSRSRSLALNFAEGSLESRALNCGIDCKETVGVVGGRSGRQWDAARRRI